MHVRARVYVQQDRHEFVCLYKIKIKNKFLPNNDILYNIIYYDIIDIVLIK